MQAGRVLRRIGKVLLWCAAFVVVLSIGLRIDSAWQVPKVRSLMDAVKTLRPGQKVDATVLQLMKAQNFAQLGWPCTSDSCWYSARVYSFVPSQNISSLMKYGGQYVGLRPWSAGATLLIEDGLIVEIRSGIGFFQGYSEVGGELNGRSRMRSVQESSPDFRIWEYPRHRDRLPQVDYTSLVTMQNLDRAFHASFSCVWALKPCTSGYQIFPEWRALSAELKRLDDVQQKTLDPCPASRMYARVRDGDQVALGTVVDGGPIQVYVRINQILRDQAQFRSRIQDKFRTSELQANAFRGGVSEGTKVIVTSGPDCSLLPATKENLVALAAAIKAFPLNVRAPREFYSVALGPGIITIQKPPLPFELRP